jgi:hypothetical protein
MRTEYIILIILYLSIMYIAIRVLRQRDQKIKLRRYEIEINHNVDTHIEEQLDNLIESVFNEYRLYNLEYRDNDYIKAIEEKKIVEDICEMVTDRISPIFITQLSTYFNINNLGDVIATKISTKVTEYRIMKNTNS